MIRLPSIFEKRLMRGSRECRAGRWDQTLRSLLDGRARYPDAIVVCLPVSFDASVVDDPVIVFEVLSDGTSKTDLIDKNREYRATPSIQRYVILQQTHRAASVFVRRGNDWLSEVVVGDNAFL